MSMPTSRRSWAISRPEQPRRFARRPRVDAPRAGRSRAPTAGRATPAAAGASPGRPPDRSAPAGGAPAARPCSSSVRARSCARSAQLRWNRMTPAGGRREQQLALGGVQRRPGDADDGRARGAPRAHASLTGAIGPTMKHWPPLPRIAPQALAAASRLGERAGLQAEQRPRAGLGPLDLRVDRRPGPRDSAARRSAQAWVRPPSERTAASCSR